MSLMVSTLSERDIGVLDGVNIDNVPRRHPGKLRSISLALSGALQVSEQPFQTED